MILGRARYTEEGPPPGGIMLGNRGGRRHLGLWILIPLRAAGYFASLVGAREGMASQGGSCIVLVAWGL